LILQVSTNNNITFYPDLQNNLDLPESERFAIVLKKQNKIQIAPYCTDQVIDQDGNITSRINNAKYIAKHFVMFKNPIRLRFDDGVKERDIELKDITTMPELDDLCAQISNRISKLYEKKAKDDQTADLKN